MAKILLIEDQRLWQKTFSDLLNREGHEVILAGSYEEAEACINAEPDIGLRYDVILLDLMLDEWNQELQGKALIPRIHEKQGSSRTKVILFTDQDVHADSIEVSQELLRQYKNLIINSCDKKQFAKAETFIELIQQALLPEKSDVRLQRLRDFTVQIRAAGTETVVGVGLLVSTEGQIVTCAQVVEKAIGRPLQEAKECEVDIYMPAMPGRDAEQRLAKVVASSPQAGVELVLLQLLGGSSPLTEEQLPVFGNAELSEQHPFRSYSYRCVAPNVGEYLQGIIAGSVDRPESIEQSQLLQLNVPQHQQTVSGNAILDVERNLIVGMVVDAEQFLAETPTIWAINAQVLESAPFNLPIYEHPLALSAIPRPKVELDAAEKFVASEKHDVWYDAPEPVKDWVGREELTTLLSQNWADPRIRITELIGFGGEGKSSLARKWVDELNKGIASTPENQRVRRPDGIFWWSFDVRPGIDEFFEAALRFLRGENFSVSEATSTPAKVELIAAMLGKSSSVFVLDGLESMQSQTGDQYGMIKNDDLRRFLTYFLAPKTQAFCLITSRIPLLELMEFATYQQHDVTQLTLEEGCELLEKIGVKGETEALEQVVKKWNGHALTLTLLGSFLVGYYHGDVSCINKINLPKLKRTQDEDITYLLHQYDHQLDEAERAFLMLFSAFRTPVKQTALDLVFRTPLDDSFKTENQFLPLRTPITALEGSEFDLALKHLVDLRLINYHADEAHYTTHPLVKNHYFQLLNRQEPVQIREVHHTITQYYLRMAGEASERPTLEELKPLIEAVHHACLARDYDEAFPLLRQRLNQGRYLLPEVLGAWDTYLDIMLDFFPERDPSQDLQLSEPTHQSSLLHEIGFCYMSLGRPRDAAPFYERSLDIKVQQKNWIGASRSYQNLSEVHTYLGELDQSLEVAQKGFDCVREIDTIEGKEEQRSALVDLAWVSHLQGNPDKAAELFLQAETLEKGLDPQKLYLFELRGVQHADHLKRIGNYEAARSITEANLKICKEEGLQEYISRCYRLLGDLDAAAEHHEDARQHYDNAVKIARQITSRDVLIEALLARGRWFASHQHDASAAFSDLHEALEFAENGPYRIYEADIRIGLAKAYLAEASSLEHVSESYARALDNTAKEMSRARRLSKKIGYHWGLKDAEEVQTAYDDIEIP